MLLFFVRYINFESVKNSRQMKRYLFSVNLSLFYSLPNSRDFCRLLITFAKSLDPDQDRQNVGPDLDPNRLTI